MKNIRGFSTIEEALLVFFVTVVGAWSAVTGLDTYRGYQFRNERNAVVGALQDARNQAIHNICRDASCADGISHGVYFTPTEHIIFEGINYASANYAVDKVVNANENIQVTGLGEVIFSRLSGEANPAGTITITDVAGHISIIDINNEGRIAWTN